MRDEACSRVWGSVHEYCAPFKDDPYVVCPSYGELCSSMTTPGQEVDVMSVLALSAVTGVAIHMYFPHSAVSFDQPPLTRLVV